MTYADEVLADSPVGYWRLEETSGTTLTDETENGNTGSVIGDPDLTISGQVGSAASCDGVDDALQTAPIGDTSQASVELWVKMPSGAGGGEGITALFSVVDSVSDNVVDGHVLEGGELRCRHRSDDSSPHRIDTTSALDDGEWHHIVYVIDIGGTHKVWVDGVEEASGSSDENTLNLSNNDMAFGAMNNRGTLENFIECSVDEPANYLSVLSQSRIRAHYFWGLSRYAGEVMDDGPVAYWRLGESSGSTAVDETTNGHDGTYNGPTLGASGALAEDTDTAASFDGVDDYVDIGNKFFGGWGAFTVEVWVYPNTLPANSNPEGHNTDEDHIIHKAGSGDDNFGLTIADGGTAFYIDTGTAYTAVATAPSVGEWTHIVAVYDGSEMRIYIDGSLDASMSASGSLGTNTNAVNIGGRFDNDFGWVDGTIDEVAVYETALSATRIQAHYDAAQPTTADTITFVPHSVLLKHQPQFDGRFSPHVVLLKHRQAVPLQYHVVNLAHLANTLSGDESEEAQAKALKKALGHGWGVPDPPGSPKEKMETPRESWPTDRFHEAERIMRQEGVEESTAKAVGEAMRRLGEDIQLDVRANLQKAEWHANVHTHSALGGAAGTPIGPAESFFVVRGSLQRRRADDGSVIWSMGSGYRSLEVDPIEERVYVAQGPINGLDKVHAYDFSGSLIWKTVDIEHADDPFCINLTLSRDRESLYVIVDNSDGFIETKRINPSDGVISTVGASSTSRNLSNNAVTDIYGDYLYYVDQRIGIVKVSLADGSEKWHQGGITGGGGAGVLADDTVIWAQQQDLLAALDPSNGAVIDSVDLKGYFGTENIYIWKDYHNTNSVYVISIHRTDNLMWIDRAYILADTIQIEEAIELEQTTRNLCRDIEGYSYLTLSFNDKTLKLNPDFSVAWTIGVEFHEIMTEQGRSVFW